VVAGLTASSKLRSSSLAVSFSVMAFTAGLILLAIFSWPFLKLTLMGQEHRLRLIDVLVVGICSLLGIALVMLFVVDWYSYDRLKEDLDGQLKQLSTDIRDNLGDEISAAYDQILILDKWTASPNQPERLSNLFTSGGLGKREDAGRNDDQPEPDATRPATPWSAGTFAIGQRRPSLAGHAFLPCELPRRRSAATIRLRRAVRRCRRRDSSACGGTRRTPAGCRAPAGDGPRPPSRSR